MSADKTKIHALVVGISRYADQSWFPDLEGAVFDALRFAAWLRSAGGMEPKDIRLFLSPTPEGRSDCEAETAKAGLTSEPATFGNIDRYLDHELPNAEVFYLFWSGHGVVDRRDERLLFYSDATRVAPNHFHLKSELAFLLGKPMRQQIGFIDACAQFFDAELRNNKQRTLGPRQNVRQSFVFGASRGQAAADSPIRRAGRFSEQLMDVLANLSFPPDQDTVIAELRKRFANERQQRPQYFVTKPFDGEEIVQGHPPSSPYVEELCEERGLPVRGLRELAQRAAKCPELAKLRVRDRIFTSLKRTAKKNLTRPEFLKHDPVEDLVHLIAGAIHRDLLDKLAEQCDQHDAQSVAILPVLRSLPKLASAFGFAKEAAILDARRVYLELGGARQPGWFDDASYMVWQLAKDPVLVAEFLYRLADSLPAENLAIREWARQYLSSQSVQRIEEDLGRRAFLFVDINVDLCGRKDTIEACLRRGRNKVIKKWASKKYDKASRETEVAAIIRQAQGLLAEPFFIQVCVPLDLLSWQLEQRFGPGTIGKHHPIAFRWRDRLQQDPETPWREWIDRHDEIRCHLEAGGSHGYLWFNSDDERFEHADPGVLTFGALNLPRIRDEIHKGAPFVAWAVSAPGESAPSQREIMDILNCGCALDDLPAKLCECRRKDATRNVALFWDDPTDLRAWKYLAS